MNGGPTVAVVGYPNVGKSTLVNRLAGGREAVEHGEPGVTRDRKRIGCEWNGVRFDLLDTGGIDLADESEMARDVQRQATIGMGEAQAIVFVVDAGAGIRTGEADLARSLMRSEVPVLVVVNKLDTPAEGYLAADFHGLGLGDPLPVSATHGLGTGELLDRVVELIGGAEVPDRPDSVRVAVIGRPNVGKSSLVNRILGEERVIVAEGPGTTRDSIDTEIVVDGHQVTLIDTAGLRRRGKTAGSIEHYAQLRSERAIERADVALVVCDSSEGVSAEDLKAGEKAMKAGCATLFLLNKWDVGETDLEDARARITRKMRLRPEVMTCSALTGRNVEAILPRAIELAERAARRIPTPELNRFLGHASAERPPPSKRGRRLKLLYGAQIGESPPRFAIQVNDRRLINRDWAFWLENRMRDEYALEGVPLILDFPARKRSRG